ncbi:transglycosylase SLT domain-containing protein [Brevundimonas sp.]|uniref:transglycosylase SLT domain-containing protein n=1 Tax=Brevundimonas sp. TaxID=1871086 RepID=UPI0022BD9347|nr:transglycosylase SLT domain-containing protein [Brevundimonas sp.]MCZ8193028.1 transglycosylase SLT domain-containing protein [Brevundimonas sp.]
MITGAVNGPGGVEAAVRRAAGATGIDSDFLIRTAQRESSMNPAARARTSSAAGLFQFIEQTWLATLKQHGPKHGYGQYADLIHQGTDGRWRVSGAARNVILDLRLDPHAASVMAAEFTAQNAAYLRGRTGREPGAGDLYAAHFLGPAGAARMMDAMQSRPGASAVALFPEAASANPGIFYRDGRPITVSELSANLGRLAGSGTPAAGAGEGPSTAAPTLSPQDKALAARLDRHRQDQALLGLLVERDGEGAGDAWRKAFGSADRA